MVDITLVVPRLYKEPAPYGSNTDCSGCAERCYCCAPVFRTGLPWGFSLSPLASSEETEEIEVLPTTTTSHQASIDREREREPSPSLLHAIIDEHALLSPLPTVRVPWWRRSLCYI